MEEEKEFCKECCREITKSEAEYNKGFCTKCYMMRKKSAEDEENTTNTVSKVIKAIAIIFAIVGIIGGLISIEFLEIMSIIIIVMSIIMAIFMYGFGEIIQILQDIYWKIKE